MPTTVGLKPRVSGYKYPHDYNNHYVKQEYMPKELIGKSYYFPKVISMKKY